MIKTLQINREVFGPLFSALEIEGTRGHRVLLARGGTFYFEIPPQILTKYYRYHRYHPYIKNRDYRDSIVYSINRECFIIPIPLYRERGGTAGTFCPDGNRFPLKNSLKKVPGYMGWYFCIFKHSHFFCRDYNAHPTSVLFSISPKSINIKVSIKTTKGHK